MDNDAGINVEVAVDDKSLDHSISFEEAVDRAEEKIMMARVHLARFSPFFFHALLDMPVKFVLDYRGAGVTTAATDGMVIYVNPHFFASSWMGHLEAAFVLAHEILHCFLSHVGRGSGRNPEIWNMAIDYITNANLVLSGIGRMPKRDGELVGLLDEERFPADMAADEAYKILYQDHKDGKLKTQRPLDLHVVVGNDDSSGTGAGSSQGAMTPEELEAVKEAVTKRISSALGRSSAARNDGSPEGGKSAGSIPVGLKRIIGEITSPRMDWRQHLCEFITSNVTSDYSYRVPDKASWVMGHGICSGYRRSILPSVVMEDRPHIAIAIDASGSQSDEAIREQLSEVQGVVAGLSAFDLYIWCFDGEVHDITCFDENTVHEISDYEISGGGGTSFECNWHFMKEASHHQSVASFELPESFVPDRFLMFTDGYPSMRWCPEGDEDYCPTLFVIHSSNNDPDCRSIKAPFGETIYYERN